MSKSIRITLAVALTVVGTSAVALAANVGSSEPSPEIPSPDLPLEEAAALATPDVGERMPACPSSEVVARLKEQGIPFGPCVPVPDDASPEQRAEALADSPVYSPEPVEEPKSEDCPLFEIRTSEGAIEAKFPCGADVQGGLSNLKDALVKHNGEHCLEFDYQLDGKTETTVFCPGASPTGEPR